MIFFGSNSSTIKKGQIRNLKCPNCENDVTMSYTVFGNYVHIYWIPFFPTGKAKILECNNCKATYNLKDLDQRTNDKFKQEIDRNPIQIPLKHFSFVGIIGVIVAGSFFLGKIKDKDTLEYGKNPKIGDVYYYETPELAGHYSTLKITKITADSIFVLENNMEIDSKTDIDDILDEKNYTYPYAYSKEEMKELTKNLEIFFKITRDQ